MVTENKGLVGGLIILLSGLISMGTKTPKSTVMTTLLRFLVNSYVFCHNLWFLRSSGAAPYELISGSSPKVIIGTYLKFSTIISIILIVNITRTILIDKG